MFPRIGAIIAKEMLHILRDPRTLAIVFALPIIMVILFGYALNMDVDNIRIAVIDEDRTPESRDLVRTFSSSDYFEIIAYPPNRKGAGHLMERGDIRAIIVIPDNFGADIAFKPSTDIQIIVDGSDPTYGNASINYTAAVTAAFSLDASGSESILPIDIRDRFLYNQDLEGSHFIIPGVIAIVLMMVCALMTSITIAHEKESGTMDVLLVSPVRPGEIVIGKVVPYIALALIDAIVILVFARLVFNVPVRGDILLLFALSVLYVFCALGMGLLISSVAPTQQVAMMIALVGTILPSIILSGFIFSIFSMPAPIRILSNIVPARHFMTIIRGILLKDSTAGMLKDQALMLAAIGTFFLAAATIRFKARIK